MLISRYSTNIYGWKGRCNFQLTIGISSLDLSNDISEGTFKKTLRKF